MKRPAVLLAVLLFVCAIAPPALAIADMSTLGLFVDSARGVRGSALWNDWWSVARTRPGSATEPFLDMENGRYPGTHDMDPYDEISDLGTGDGRSLAWVFWIPSADAVSIPNDYDFDVKWVRDQGESVLTWDSDLEDWVADAEDLGWTQPLLETYSGGVVGTFGFTLDSNFQDLETFRQGFLDPGQPQSRQTFARGLVRYRARSGHGGEKTNWEDWEDWKRTSLQLDMRPESPSEVPEPGTVALFGILFTGAALAAARRKMKFAR